MAAVPILASALSIGLLDMVWLSLRNTYHSNLFQTIQGSPLKIRWGPAIAIYIILPIAVYFYAVRVSSSLNIAFFKGALLGFMLYAFYDLTNYATIQGWTLEMTITDTLWGILVCSMGAGIGYIFSSTRLQIEK